MSDHRVVFSWNRGGAAFTSTSYPRGYELHFADGPTVPGGPALEYGGVAGRVDPEQALVAALSSCHALTVLALAAKRRLIIDSYEDDASCRVAKMEDGKIWVDMVWLRPKLVFAQPIDDAALKLLHEQAHRHCFIANSVKSDVRVEPRL